MEDLKAAQKGSVAGSDATAALEESIWLCPIVDRRRLDSSREGMLEGFSLGSYLLLVDYTGRLLREGKAVISRLVFIGVHVKCRDITPIILSGALGLLMALIAYGRMVLNPIS